MVDNEVSRFAPNGYRLPDRLQIGHLLVDNCKQHWLIGPTIGSGGFGEIYLTRQYDYGNERNLTQSEIIKQSSKWTHAIKFEHFSGPLFAEINFYLRVAKRETIDEYMSSKKLKSLGMPRYIGSGIYDPSKPNNPAPVCKSTSTIGKTKASRQQKATVPAAVAACGAIKQANKNNIKEKKYRFLVMQRFGLDVEKILTHSGSRFDMKTAFTLALKIIDTLEYIHSHGYVHADVKASNLLMSHEKNSHHEKYEININDQVYLIDFGLVEKFCHKDGQHREYTEDQRRANNGTVEFSSRDAHIGAFSRRADLESLAYNLLYWVSGGRLPWVHCLKDHSLVEASKKYYMLHLEEFVNYCFNELAEPVDPSKLTFDCDVETSKFDVKHSNANNGTNGHYLNNHGNCNNINANGYLNNSTDGGSSAKKPRKEPASRVKSRQSSTHDSIMCAALYDFICYISRLSFQDAPDYYLLKQILSNALIGSGMEQLPSGTQLPPLERIGGRTKRSSAAAAAVALAFSPSGNNCRNLNKTPVRKTQLKKSKDDNTDGINGIKTPGAKGAKVVKSDKVVTKSKKQSLSIVLPKCDNPTPAMLEILRKMQEKNK